MKSSNDNASKTPVFDNVLAALAATYTGADRWTAEGWAEHIRGARHANHAINSLVKHADEFGPAVWPAVFVLTVARCVDAGLPSEEAAAEIHARRAARTLRAA